MKIVINTCYGGFSLSDAAITMYCEAKNLNTKEFCEWEVPRNDATLISIVEKLGDSVNTGYSKLRIVEIPEDVNWTVEQYDGNEWVAEVHRTWRY